MYDDIQLKEDGSFIITKNSLPYHIPNDDIYKEEYNAVKEYIKNNPEKIRMYHASEYEMKNEKTDLGVRIERNNLLSTADKLLLKYMEEVELGIIKPNENYRKALLQYKLELRDITKKKEFPNVIFPEIPVCK